MDKREAKREAVEHLRKAVLVLMEAQIHIDIVENLKFFISLMRE